MQPFEWVTVRTESEAANAGATTVAAVMATPAVGRDAFVLKAGGIDLLNLMKADLLQPRRVVNLRSVSKLDRIVEVKDGALRIGALATVAQVAQHPLVRDRYGALADATGNLASPQIRNMATLGGNLLQRPQCWYFRSAQHLCARKGGGTCFAFGGENQYHAVFEQNGCAIVHPSTAATALVALGAAVELIDAKEARRQVRLEDFYVRPDQDLHRENDLKPGELLAAVLLPKPAAGTHSVHLKQGEKDSFDWPLADVAVALRCNAGGRCEDASIVLGAAAPVPYRARAAQAALQGRPVDEATAREVARTALEGATPLSKNAYKLPIFEALVRRAILAAAQV